MQIKCVIGANYGDEGKGTATHYFCSKIKTPVLNIRYNGGSQAGHRVCLKDGREHVFSTFGSGSFHDNVDTYLSEFFIFNPLLFLKDLDAVRSKGIKGKIYVDNNSVVTTPYDMFINQLENEDNGCRTTGCGIYKTVLRNRNNCSVLADVLKHGSIKALLEDVKSYYLNEYENDTDFSRLSKKQLMKFFRFLDNKIVVENFCQDVERALGNITIVNKDDVKNLEKHYDNLVFEGAQGCLLSEEKNALYNTPSKCGFDNIKHILETNNIKCSDDNLEVSFITRSYLTRHGSGEFKTEFTNGELYGQYEETNITNEFQGSFRRGAIDIKQLKSTLEEECLKIGTLTSDINLFVTHLDETDDKICTDYGLHNIVDIENLLNDGRLSVKTKYKCYSKYGDVVNGTVF